MTAYGSQLFLPHESEAPGGPVDFGAHQTREQLAVLLARLEQVVGQSLDLVRCHLGRIDGRVLARDVRHLLQVEALAQESGRSLSRLADGDLGQARGQLDISPQSVEHARLLTRSPHRAPARRTVKTHVTAHLG